VLRRDLLRTMRQPDVLAFAVVMGVFFLVLFNYVFGGSIGAGAGVDYLQFLVPGVLVITALQGAQQTSMGLAADLTEGVVNRLRSLPMSQVAVLAGETLADGLRNIVSCESAQTRCGRDALHVLAVPADARKYGVHPRLDDARVAATIRHVPADLGCGGCRARTSQRKCRDRYCPPSARVDSTPTPCLRPALCPLLPQGRLMEPQHPSSRTTPAEMKPQQRIMHAVMELIAERGLSGITMSDLANTATVSRQTLYNYYSDVDSAVAAALGEHNEVALAQLDTSLSLCITPEDRMGQLVRHFAALGAHGHGQPLERGLSASTQRHLASHDQAVGVRIQTAIGKGIESGTFRPDITASDMTLVHSLLRGVQEATSTSPTDAAAIVDSSTRTPLAALYKRAPGTD